MRVSVSGGSSSRGWVGWVAQNKLVAGGVALALVTLSAGVIVVASRSDTKSPKHVEATATTVSEESSTSLDTATTVVSASTSPGGATRVTLRNGRVVETTGKHSLGGSVGGISVDTTCSPAKGYKATGVTETSINIGQIVTDVAVLPAQLYPNAEGLYAFIQDLNAHGGVCGRKVNIDYSNDNFSDQLHQQQYAADVRKDFAFVANSALGDSVDYDTKAPFDPIVKDTGESKAANQFVPDIGGLAYNYNRAQSSYHAGAIGSLSPALTGGGAFKLIVDNAANPNPTHYGPCRMGGVVYLDVPGNTASQDSSEEGAVALAASWGGNLDPNADMKSLANGTSSANVRYYHQGLAAQQAQYQLTVQQMIADGVNCAFTYADLGSNETFVKALTAEHVWPPNACDATHQAAHQCFAAIYMPFAGYDEAFIPAVQNAALGVQTFIPHPPFSEIATDPALKNYNAIMSKYLPVPGDSRKDIKASFAIIGYTSGVMFFQAVQACGPAPERSCVVDYLHKLQDFKAGGLLGGTSPFAAIKVVCNGDCGPGFTNNGTFNFKGIFTCSIGLQVVDKGGRGDTKDFEFVRTSYTAASGYFCDALRVVRGKPG